MKRADINIFLAIIAKFALALVLNEPNRSATPNPMWEPVALRSPSELSSQPTTDLAIRRAPQQPQSAVADRNDRNVPAPAVRPVEFTANRLPATLRPMTRQPRYLPPSVLRNRQSGSRMNVPIHPSSFSASEAPRVMPLPPARLEDDTSVRAAVYRMGPGEPNPVRFANGWAEL